MPNHPIPREDIHEVPPEPKPARQAAALYLAVWRAKRRIESGGDPERTVFMVERYIDEALETLDEVGVTFRDYLGHPYGPGLRAVLPVHFEARDGVAQPIVGETIAPAIFVGDQLVEKSRVVVHAPAAKPAEKQSPDEKAPQPKTAGAKPSGKAKPTRKPAKKTGAAAQRKAAPKKPAAPKSKNSSPAKKPRTAKKKGDPNNGTFDS